MKPLHPKNRKVHKYCGGCGVRRARYRSAAGKVRYARDHELCGACYRAVLAAANARALRSEAA